MLPAADPSAPPRLPPNKFVVYRVAWYKSVWREHAKDTDSFNKWPIRGLAEWRCSCFREPHAREREDVVMPKKKKPAANDRRSTDRRAKSSLVPTESDIARRAYELFLQRGGKHGRDTEDWLLAERELRSADR